MGNETPGNKKFNLMILMAADNSLSEECVFSLKELRRIGPVENVGVMAQFHTSAKNAHPRRYRIKSPETDSQPTPKKSSAAGEPAAALSKYISDADGKLEEIAEEIFDNVTTAQPVTGPPNGIFPEDPGADPDYLGCINEGGPQDGSRKSPSNPKVVSDFIVQAMAENEGLAACNILVLSGHGSGAVGEFLSSKQSRTSLDISEVKDIFPDIVRFLPAGKIDILIMDSCLMSMAEVACELSDKAAILIGSEGYELSTGWPYHHLMDTINTASINNSDPKTLARNLVEKYREYYYDFDVAAVSVDIAALDLSHMKRLVEAVRELTKALLDGIRNDRILDAIILAHWRAQSYNAEQYVDLWDFCDQLAQYETNKSIEKACESVQEIIANQSLVLKSCYSGAAFQHSHGVSIYFPWAADTQHPDDFEDLKKYNRLGFSRDTGWGEFLKEYLCKSRRPVRRPGKGLKGTEKLKVFIPTDESRINIRTNDPFTKGGSGLNGKMKNPPVGFYRGPCE